MTKPSLEQAQAQGDDDNGQKQQETEKESLSQAPGQIIRGETKALSDESAPAGAGSGSSSDMAEPASKQQQQQQQQEPNARGEADTNDDSACSREGYTADCSSDASSAESSSTKKKDKDNIILPVNNLSIAESEDGDEKDVRKAPFAQRVDDNGKTILGHHSHHHRQHKYHHHHHHKHNDIGADTRMKKGTIRPVPGSATTTGGASASSQSHRTEDSRLADKDTDNDSQSASVQINGVNIVHPMDPRIDISKVGYLAVAPPLGQINQQHHNSAPAAQDEAPPLEHYLQLMEVVRPFFDSHGIGEGPSPPSGAQQALHTDNMKLDTSRARGGTSTSQSTSSGSSGSAKKVQKDAPLHLRSEDALDAPKPPAVPLQLAARQNPLAAAEEANFYAPDDDLADEDDSETSSMIVLARTKKKHKAYSSGSSESASQEEQNGGVVEANQGIEVPTEAGEAMNIDIMDNDGKPAAQALSHRQEDNDNRVLQEPDNGQGNASSSSSSDQRIEVEPPAGAHQARHNYDSAHLVTESSNTNTSGSGGNSGSNQGSSGSGNGSSGNEGKGSSEGAGAKEGRGEHSNSDDVNSDERVLKDKDKEVTHSVAAPRRHGPGAVINDGATAPMNPDIPSPQPMGNQKNEAARERKLQHKKRKRMDMRREYEEKVQEEMESSESSAAKGAVSLRPGRPITLDKVLSFTKIPRMLIQAAPPFLVVHTNAAYTRLTGIDAHAAVGKPVSALLSVQSPSEAANQAAIGQNIDHQPIQVQEVAGTSNGMSGSASVNLERLVAASGFGKFHILYAKARPHQMLGRNVIFITKAGVAAALPPSASANGISGQEDTNSATTCQSPFEALKCRSSLSPIISDTADAAAVTDNNQEPHSHKGKRRKSHHHGGVEHQGPAAGVHHSRRPLPKRNAEGAITHYAIQLEVFDESKELNGSNSLSSTSVAAGLLRINKEQLRRQREVAGIDEEAELHQPNDDEVDSETTEAVTAVG